jgi:anaerobic selenocysteine-containing dehydrogenase
VVEAEGDKIEEWEFFWGMGRRMGLAMSLGNGPIAMDRKPTKFELLENITAGSRVPLAQMRANAGGTVYPDLDVIIEAADPATQGYLELFPAGLGEELAAAYRDTQAPGTGGYSHLLISRRMKNTYNSTGPELSLLKSKGTTNPAFMHPRDLAALGIADGEVCEVYSAHGQIPAVAAASADIKPGVISMSHCWGGSPDPALDSDARVRELGSNTNRLIDNRQQAEKYSGMPRQSTIPVGIRKLS